MKKFQVCYNEEVSFRLVSLNDDEISIRRTLDERKARGGREGGGGGG